MGRRDPRDAHRDRRARASATGARVSREQTLSWLAALQGELSAMLHTPLDSEGGALSAAPERYPQALLARVRKQPGPNASERLAVYNRQYWLRLLRALQNDLPLFTALLGPWFFNQVAQRFLRARPPRNYDL